MSEWEPSERQEGCAFCDITHGDSPAEIVYADDECMAFLDRRPLFPGHVLVAPRAHVPELALLPDEMVPRLFTLVRAMSLAVRLATGSDGAFVAVNDRVSQSVPHLHVHVVPRRFHDGLRGFFWPRHAYGSDAERERVRAAVADAVATVLGLPSPPDPSAGR